MRVGQKYFDENEGETIDWKKWTSVNRWECGMEFDTCNTKEIVWIMCESIHQVADGPENVGRSFGADLDMDIVGFDDVDFDAGGIGNAFAREKHFPGGDRIFLDCDISKGGEAVETEACDTSRFCVMDGG